MTNRRLLARSAPTHAAKRLATAMVATAILSVTFAAIAGEADVLNVKARTGSARDTFSFDVTIRSRDSGWDYYAERFEVIAPDGSMLGERILLHPHTDEQPFTRELEEVRIADSIRFVTVRAWMKRGAPTRAVGGESARVPLPGR